MDPMKRLCAGVTAAQGRICRAAVVQVVADVPLCQSHLRKITDALAGSPRLVASAVVYYVGDPGAQQVKIGSSTRMATRFAAVAEQRPGAVLLAVEPGHHDLEMQRHREWRKIRVAHHGGSREWYHKHPELLEWITEVRTAHGDPWAHPAVAATR